MPACVWCGERSLLQTVHTLFGFVFNIVATINWHKTLLSHVLRIYNITRCNYAVVGLKYLAISIVILLSRDDVDDAGEELAEEEAENDQMQDMIMLDIDAGEW